MAFVAGFVIAAAVTPLAIWAGPRLGLVDQPGDDPLKIHEQTVPRTGGWAVLAALVPAPFLVELPWQVVVGALAVWVLGTADDRFDLPALARLVVEVGVAIVVAVAIAPGDPLRIALGALVIVASINAANLFDGLDGLLAGCAALSAVGLAVMSSGTSDLAWLLTGAVLGFLVYNVPPARVFLGDGGSYLIGYSLGVLIVGDFGGVGASLGAVLALGIIGGDLVLTVVRRRLAGRPLFLGDRSHVYDQLRDRGKSIWRVLATMWGGHGLLVLAGLFVATLADAAAIAVFIVVIGVAAGLTWRLGFLTVSNR